jgi:hypothetical protein
MPVYNDLHTSYSSLKKLIQSFHTKNNKDQKKQESSSSTNKAQKNCETNTKIPRSTQISVRKCQNAGHFQQSLHPRNNKKVFHSLPTGLSLITCLPPYLSLCRYAENE